MGYLELRGNPFVIISIISSIAVVVLLIRYFNFERSVYPLINQSLYQDSESFSRPQLETLLKEKARQVKKWGIQQHTLEGWIAILEEEVAELVTEIRMLEEGYDTQQKIRKEAIEVATVALTIAFIKEVDK